MRDAKLNFEKILEDTSAPAAPLRFSFSDLDSSQGGEQMGGVQLQEEMMAKMCKFRAGGEDLPLSSTSS